MTFSFKKKVSTSYNKEKEADGDRHSQGKGQIFQQADRKAIDKLTFILVTRKTLRKTN